MSRYTTVERGLVEALNSISEKLRHRQAVQGNWTRAVIDGLAQVAGRHGCQACGHNCERREFLNDLVWLRVADDGAIDDALLTVECEWGNRAAVEADFDKLLLTRAEHRLMIFDGTRFRDSIDLIERLCENARRFRKTRKRDRYLFAFWKSQRKNRDGFQFRQYVA